MVLIVLALAMWMVVVVKPWLADSPIRPTGPSVLVPAEHGEYSINFEQFKLEELTRGGDAQIPINLPGPPRRELLVLVTVEFNRAYNRRIDSHRPQVDSNGNWVAIRATLEPSSSE